MARSKYSGAPIAPSRTTWLLAGKLRAQGRRDSVKYVGLNDYTRTHALIVAQSSAQSGQHEVNQWIIKQIEPLQVGNSRLLVLIEDLKDELGQIRSKKDTSPRRIRENQTAVERIQKQVSNERAQLKANRTTITSIALAGQEALDSWESFYQDMAGIYARARALKSRLGIAAVTSEVPTFKAIEMSQISDFDTTDK